MKKNIVICNFPRFSREIWLPILWAQTKTYYEMYGQRTTEWNWVPCYADIYDAEHQDKIKEILLEYPPDIFAISLYVWNYTLAYEIAKWVKLTWPNCIIVSGGPHQYFKHDANWFKNHKFLDASYPGDCYGEIAFMEMLDNYNNTTMTVDWSKVTDIRYPSKSRMLLSNLKTMSTTDKKKYHYQWSAFKSQLKELQDFVDYQYKNLPNSMLLSVLETTRGCPYGCTYCDWGGGTNTTVLQKELAYVEADILALASFELTHLYIADANFGIFGQRDIEVIKMLAKQKNILGNQFKIGYGGFAKTENKLEYIKEILKIDVDYSLSNTKELKISLQTLDKQILSNIDRKNIDLDKQLAIFKPLSIDKKLPLYVEMIMGLPGLTLDKYYFELDVLGERKLSVQWYEWILLPETPAYSYEYRKRFGIETIIKKRGWAVLEQGSEREVVVACTGFSNQDYMQMILSNSLYHLFVLGGYYKNSLNWIRDTYNIGYGKISKDIYENFFDSTEVNDQWQVIVNDPNVPCTFNVCGEIVYGAYYFVAKAFLDQSFANNLINYLQQKYNIPQLIINKEKDLQINSENYNKTLWKNFYKISYKKDISFGGNNIHSIIGAFGTHIDAGGTMLGKKKLFGIINVDTNS